MHAASASGAGRKHGDLTPPGFRLIFAYDMYIVPSALLVPPEAHGRGFSPDEAALVLDGYLRRLAAQNAHCRAVLGRLARRFLTRRGHHELGFARLGDYGRERLGRSAREIQCLAAVSAALERLPGIRAAFERG